MPSIRVAALYKFAALHGLPDRRASLQSLCDDHGLRGTILLADEGINGTIAGPPDGVQSLLDRLRSDVLLADLEAKESWTDRMPFHRMKVRIKKEIVTLGVPGVDPTRTVGAYVDAKQWNALLDDPDVLVLDTRNEFECRIGTFDRAVNPHTTSFTEFPAFVRSQLDPAKHKKVAMFCTGGIRCEKASSFLLGEGFPAVFHLRGGILKYMETTAPEDSRWQGACVVFDQRAAVDHSLAPADISLCFNCRNPLTAAEREHPGYEANVSCPHCVDTVTDRRRAGLRERARQMALAAARGERHLGFPVSSR